MPKYQEIYYRVWQQNRDRLVGFMARGAVNSGNGWAYMATGSGNVQSVLLTNALFHHIYYSYVSWALVIVLLYTRYRL